MNKDLICHHCKVNEATYLLYFIKNYKDSSNERWIDPCLICDDCLKRFCRDNELFEYKPRIVSFKAMATMEPQTIGYLFSKKGKFSNDMANPFWRKKILRIQALYKGKRRKEDREEALL